MFINSEILTDTNFYRGLRQWITVIGLRDMAMRPIFRSFCINRLGIGPLHNISSRSNFGFEFAEIFVIDERLPDSASQGVADTSTRRVGESFFDYEYLREFKVKIGTARKVV
jgi:hypothetical protein